MTLFQKKLRNRLIILALCILLAVLVVWQPISFAWLASALRSSTFQVKSSAVSQFENAELWIYADKQYGDKTAGWNKVTIDGDTSTSSSKFFSAIGAFGTESGKATFTPSSAVSLYFGTVNNLVQEQENQPIFLKYHIKLKPQSENTVILQYATGEDYISLYPFDFTDTDATTGKYVGKTEEENANYQALLATLNDSSAYPFLRFHYFVSETNYELDEGSSDLTKMKGGVDFPALFEGDDVVEYVQATASTHTIDFTKSGGITRNTAATEKDLYIYVKINVRSDTLSQALTKTDLTDFIPGYLLFAVTLGLEIQTTAYTTASTTP